MITLIKVAISAVSSFLYMNIFKLRGIKKLSERERVFESRKLLKKLSQNLVKAAKINLEIEYIDKIEIDKLKLEDGIVVVSNHQSNIDIPVIVTALDIPVGFVAKKEMETWPFYSTWMLLSKCVFLDRSNAREGIKSIKKAVKIVKDGYPTVIFPEGERSIDGKIKKFKKGSFKLATDANGIIIPLTIDGTFSVQKRGEVKINSNKTVRITVGKPIILKEIEENQKGTLNEIVQKAIADEMKKKESNNNH